jgi:hypothetical protein
MERERERWRERWAERELIVYRRMAVQEKLPAGSLGQLMCSVLGFRYCEVYTRTPRA